MLGVVNFQCYQIVWRHLSCCKFYWNFVFTPTQIYNMTHPCICKMQKCGLNFRRKKHETWIIINAITNSIVILPIDTFGTGLTFTTWRQFFLFDGEPDFRIVHAILFVCLFFLDVIKVNKWTVLETPYSSVCTSQ